MASPLRTRRGSGFSFGEVARDATLARQDEAVDRRRPMRDYALVIPVPQLGPLRFEDFPYQEEWYSPEVAEAEEVVWLKSTQVGMSEYAWRWAVRQTDQFGETGVYIFPTDTHVQEFGDERIEPAIEESPYLRSRILPKFVRHKRLKRIGQGFLHLRGSNSKAGAQSVAAQFVVFDEYDFLDPGNVPQIERRISGARQLGKHPRIRRLGTPTIEGEGIAAAFESSDKREWIVDCPECGYEQQVTWEQNVRWRNPGDETVHRAGHDVFEDPKAVEHAWRACAACEAELDVRKGEWVAQQPGRKVLGFHVTRLIVHGVDLKQIVVASRSTKTMEVEAFENNDLGRPYSPAEASLDQATILRACSMGRPPVPAYNGPYPVTMGVDMAGERDISVRISEQLPAETPNTPNPRRALAILEVKSVEAVSKLIELYRPAMVVVDSNPERRFAKALRATFPGRVVLCEYDDRYESEAIVVTTGEPATPLEGVVQKVRVNRTESIDAMMDGIRTGTNRPLSEPPPKYTDHLRSLKRVTELNKAGRPVRRYKTTGTLGDDYAHAEVYDLVATELWRMAGGLAQMAPVSRHLSQEEMGFERVRLDGSSDDYRPGLGGV